ncbi:pyrroline-5-carboxylate reductase [Thiothrix eikelboomii]|uniref:Pyrroline-5-carboxylate reductase n=1 Tax=Thiothrix eikelboomii TaxID=92487 RepID=A0A1T4VUP6_9GAMM|nr:pyrroline-5-carboxylate reductase [Thiothrix eikelboomii]SKA68676.1 pyrroline-5-carboxylate reductase [Thiothrix eikelboomii]
MTPQLSRKLTTVAFIGAGNMARSLIVGMLQDAGELQIRVSDPDQNQLDVIRSYGSEIFTSTDNQQVIDGADVVVLAVKPQVLRSVLEPLQTLAQKQQPLFVSIAAGIREASLNTWLGGRLPIVRCMPNTPALVKAGATGLYANSQVSKEQRSLAESILRTVGITLWFEDEDKLDAVTAVSGSGPAYFFLVMEAMQAAAESLGLKPEDAQLLVVQTALGAARLALESDQQPADLRKQVTSKGGTTEAALNQLNTGGLVPLFAEALKAAEQRSKELAQANT